MAQIAGVYSSVTPHSGSAGSPLFELTVSITVPLGNSDSIITILPFPSAVAVVKSVSINGTGKPLMFSGGSPNDSSYVTWTYLQQSKKVILQTYDTLLVRSIVATIVLTLPRTSTLNVKYRNEVASRLFSETVATSIDSGLTFSVTPDAAYSVTIGSSPDGSGQPLTTVSASTDTSLVLYAVARDIFNNVIDTVRCRWTLTPPLGSLDNDDSTAVIRIDPMVIGASELTALNATLIDGVMRLSIRGGALHHVGIRSEANGGGNVQGPQTIPSDSMLMVFAAAFDRDSNYLSDTSVTWRTTGTLDAVNDSTGKNLFWDPVHAFTSGKIVAAYSDTIADTSGTITVTAGAKRYMMIVDTLTSTGKHKFLPSITTDDSITVYCAFIDADSNFISNPKGEWRDSLDIVDFTHNDTSRTTVIPHRTGSGLIVAESEGYQAYEFLTIGAGAVHHLLLRSEARGAGAVVTDLIIPTDSLVRLHAAAYDRKDNFIQDVNVTWTIVTGNDSIVTADVPAISIDPDVAGQKLFVRAVYSPTISAYTDSMDIVPGSPAFIMIADAAGQGAGIINRLTMTADSSIVLFASLFDADSNFIRNPIVFWNDSTLRGTFTAVTDSQTTFLANTAGSGILTIIYGNMRREMLMSVTAGIDHHVFIRTRPNDGGSTVSKTTIPADSILHLFASVYDQDSNFTGNKTAVWSMQGLSGSITDQGGGEIIFDPKISGSSGTIHAVVNGTLSAATDSITVTNGSIARLEAAVRIGNVFQTVQRVSLKSGESLRLFAVVFDTDSNLIGTYPVKWKERSGIGTLDIPAGDSTLITARSSGFSTLELDSGSLSRRIPLEIDFSPIYRISITHEGHSPADSIASVAMTADSVLSLRAFALDSLGNHVGDSASVSWYVITGSDSVLAAADTNRWTFTPQMVRLTAHIECRTMDGSVRTSIPLDVYRPVALRYQTGSLDSTIVRPNDTMSFRFSLFNDGDINAILDTLTAVRFTDDSGRSVTASLKQNDTIPSGGLSKRVETRSVIIPDELTGETYTPYFTISGQDSLGQRIPEVTLQGDPNSIYVPRVHTVMTVQKKRLTIEYDSVKFTVRYRNYGGKVTDLSWGILPDSFAFASVYTTKGISELAEKDLDSVMMTGIFAAGLDSGTMFLRSFLRGQVHGNVFTSISDNSEPVILQHEPKISFRDSIFAPKRRTIGSPVNITAYLRNERPNLLRLDSVNTRFQMTERTSSLSYVISVDPRSANPALGTGEIRSDSSTAMSRIPAGKYEVRLLIAGIDGNGNPYTDTLTAQNDTLTIDQPADLRVVSNEKRSITAGQEYAAYPVVIANAGTSDVTLHDSLCSLIITNGHTSSTLTMTENASIPAGTQARIVFRADSLQILPLSSYTHMLIFGGKDGNGETFLDTVSEASVSLSVMAPPKLEQLAVSPSLVVLRGQSYAPMVSIHNAGGTGITLNLNTTLTFFDGADSLVFPLAESIFVDKRETVNLKFSPRDIHDTLDSFTATLTYSGRDQNGMTVNRTRLHDPAIVSVYTPKLIYQRISLAPLRIPAGAQSFPFTVRIKNSGNIAVTLDDSTYLSAGLIDTLTLSTFPTIGPGDSATLSFHPLTVPASWPSGVIPAVLHLHGKYDTLSRRLYSAVLADSIDVYATNVLSLSAFSPASVTTGQGSVQFTATVINHGAVAVTIDPDTTQIRIDSQLMIPMTGKPVSIGPGGSAELEFEPFDVPGSPNGVVPAVFHLVANDIHGNPVQIQFRRDITIHTGPVLVSVNPANDTIFVKQRSYSFRIPVLNSGDIGFTADTGSSVMIGNDSALVSNILSESVIASHTVRELTFRSIPFTDDSVNSVFPLNIRLMGEDDNTKEFDTTLFAIRRVMVVDTLLPVIVRTGSNAVTKINPDSILTGSHDSQLRFRIINRNTTALGIDSIRFHFNGDTLGAYAVSGTSGALLIAPKDSLEQEFSVYAGPGVPLGPTDIGMKVHYRLHTYDSSQASMELQRVHTWTVRPAPVLAIDTVISSLGTMPVTEGSTHPFFIEVTLKNRSQKNVQINSGTLTFISGNTVMTDVLYSIDAGSSLHFGDIIPANTVGKVRFIVMKMGKFRGENAIIVQSRVFGTEMGSGVRLADSTFIADPRHPLLTLLKQPSLEFVRLITSKATVDAGDSVSGNPKVRTTVRNGGQAPMLQVTLDSIHWYFGGIRRENFRYLWKEAGNDISIPGDSSASFEVSLTKNDIHPDSTNSIVTASLFFSGIDPYSGNAKIIDSLSAWDGTFFNAFRFQRRASISIDTPMIVLEPYDSIVVKNRTIFLRATIQNLGAGTVSDIDVTLTTSNTKTKIAQSRKTIPLLDSLQGSSVDFEITTADTADITEQLTVTLSGGNARNSDNAPQFSRSAVNYLMKYLPGPPLIRDVRYVDNGYTKFPDALLNKGDLIKITFNDSIALHSSLPLDSLASRYFSIVPNTYHFGKLDASKIKKAEQVAYEGADKNSVLFIELGDDALLAIGDSVYGKQQNGFNKISQTATQSQIIINPAIEKKLLIGSKGNDAGLPIYREQLASQLLDTTFHVSTKQGESKNTLAFFDPIPPMISMLTPSKSSDRFSSIGLFVTGRNLISENALKGILEAHGVKVADSLLNNHHVLSRTIEELLDPIARSSIRSKLKIYKHEINDVTAKYYTNPEYIFYNEVDFTAIEIFVESNKDSVAVAGVVPDISTTAYYENTIIPYANVKKDNPQQLIDLDSDSMRISIRYQIIGEVLAETVNTGYVILSGKNQKNSYQDSGYVLKTAPNPYTLSRGSMVLDYVTREAGSIKIHIIDSGGRVVMSFHDHIATANVRNRILWNGRNIGGQQVARGMYLAVMTMNDKIKAKWGIYVK